MIRKYKLNLELIGLIILTFYILTASLYVAIFNSLAIQVAILSGILYILIISKLINKKKYLMEKSDNFWVLAIILILASQHSGTYTTAEIGGPLIFVLCILISFFIRNNTNNYLIILTIIKWAGLFFALSVILAYVFPRVYYNIFIVFLRNNVAQRVVDSMNRGFLAGFTSDSSFVGGYIVFGLGVIFCNWIITRNKKGVITFIVMFLALLLTQKRAHLLFCLFAMVLISLRFTNGFHEKIKKYIKIISTLLIAFLLFTVIVLRMGIGTTLFNRMIQTIEAFQMGQDITSGRLSLINHAWQLFLENPLRGIGWGNYSETVIGAVSVRTEMEAHNIYMQLLSETGIIGFLGILAPFFVTYYNTVKSIKIIVLHNKSFSPKIIMLVMYSFFIQTFFLLYGLTGNPLNDHLFLAMYFLSCGMIYSFRRNYYINVYS